MAIAYHCFQCYGANPVASGRCVHCGGEIAAPPGASYDERLAWTLHHPDPDRAITAARILGERRAGSAAGALRDVVREPPDPFLAAEALRSLVAIEGPSEIRPLLEQVAAAESFLPAQVAREALQSLEEMPED
jgi:hypothetical protein